MLWESDPASGDLWQSRVECVSGHVQTKREPSPLAMERCCCFMSWCHTASEIEQGWQSNGGEKG